MKSIRTWLYTKKAYLPILWILFSVVTTSAYVLITGQTSASGWNRWLILGLGTLSTLAGIAAWGFTNCSFRHHH